MNATQDPKPAHLPPPPPEAEPRTPDMATGSLSELLKDPELYALGLSGSDGNGARIAGSLAAGAAGTALFFFAAGFFAGWRVALFDAAKGAGIALFAFTLCLPSLYVFSCVGGAKLRAGQIAALGAACLATAGLLLAALAPVLWLFAVSTSSAGFMTFLAVFFAVPALWFAIRPAHGLKRTEGLRAVGGIRLWLAVLAVVAMQAVTLLRPMLAEPPRGRAGNGALEALGLGGKEKMFFLEHFGRALSGEGEVYR